MLEALLHQSKKLTSDWVNLIQGNVRVIEQPFTLKDYTPYLADGRIYLYNQQTQHLFYNPHDNTFTPIVNANHTAGIKVCIGSTMYYVGSYWQRPASTTYWYVRVGVINNYATNPTFTQLTAVMFVGATSAGVWTVTEHKGKLYIITMASTGDKMYVYDPVKNTLVEKTKPIATSLSPPFATTARYLYIRHYLNATTVQINRYNPDTDSWLLLDGPPTNSSPYAGILQGSENYLYYIDGLGTSDTKIWAMDINTNEWTTVTLSLGYPLRQITQLNGRLYVITTNVEATSQFIEIS